MMNRLVFNFLLAISFLSLTSLRADSFYVQKKEYTKEIKKDYKYHGSELISLNNQFGKITVDTWEKDRVRLSIEIKVKAENEAHAQQIFNRISIQFNESGDLIEAVTNIAKEDKPWWNWSNDKADFEINYFVFMPKDADLKIYNKYGDIYLASLTGLLDLHLKYGNYKCNGTSGKSNFYLKYADGKINSARQLSVELKYGSLDLTQAEDLSIESKYSTVSIENIFTINAETGYDNYTVRQIDEFVLNGKYNNISIDKVNVFFANSKYSHFTFGEVKNFASFDVSYSEVEINRIDPSFNEIRLLGRYSDFDIQLAQNASYQLDAKSEYAGITYPGGMNVSYEKEHSSEYEVKGGTGDKNAPLIKARLKYGSLKIREY